MTRWFGDILCTIGRHDWEHWFYDYWRCRRCDTRLDGWYIWGDA